MTGLQTLFDDHARKVLAGIADWMIPAAGDMPSASEAGVADHLLDIVLTARPDLEKPLLDVVAKLDGRLPEQAIIDLQTGDPAGFGVLAEVVPNAYFMSARVRELVGYPGQVGLEVDMTWPPDWLDLLEPVIERGPIYRDTSG